MMREAYESGRIPNASQDGNREFISLLACINATGQAIPPSLIYKGESTTLQSSWIEDWLPENVAHFAISPNGWSCNTLGLHWLEAIFHRYTKDRAGRGRRLLIVDGHSSHVNLRFINLCDRLRILLLILPPHTTHRLQPLDVSLFAALARYYTNGLNNLIANSYGMISISKRDFWSIFWPAWQEAFTPKNITSGFEKTGIWPCNPLPMLAKITKPLPVIPDTPIGLKTPLTCHAIRCIEKEYRKAPNSAVIKKLFRATEKLTSQHSIDIHTIKGLTQTLKIEKKRRQRGKRLNLLGENDSGPQFFSPGRIQAAREYQDQKDTQVALRQQQLASTKALAATKRVEKEAERLQRRQAATEARIQKAADRQAQQELKNAIATTNKAPASRNSQTTSACKAPKRVRKQSDIVDHVTGSTKQKDVISATSRGRQVYRPHRFDY